MTTHLDNIRHFDIVIVGAGLVGASLAALLNDISARVDSERSLTVALIDAGAAPAAPEMTQEPPQFDPRVVALTQASQQLFQRLHLWDGIAQQRACAYTDMHVWDHDGTAHLHFQASDIQQAELGHIVENSLLQSAVMGLVSASRHCVELIQNVSVVNIEQPTDSATDTNRVLLECSDGLLLSASLLVAADGGQSRIREQINMPTREWDYQHKAIVATIKTEHSHQHTAWQNFLPTGPLALLPLKHTSEQYCSIVWSIDSGKADEMMALDDAQFCQHLSRASQSRLGQVESISQRFCFPLKQRHAKDYSQGNVVLIGDAAHTIHPLAGQGVNLGLLDAQALAAEIERALQRGLSINHASVLRRYQRQRQGHNVEVMLLMEGLKRLFGHRHIAVRLLRNLGLKKVHSLSFLKKWLTKQAVQQHD